ncbi:MAG: tol-pal system-associated acyl-CoA thioesterase [Gammaproteobacteria bacterium]|nr:tol-pal system-associated acyl-CoA thioesterase [Gammaproteobacteria bacterium]
MKVKCRVYYEDTDAGGIVYYANYLKYYERARTEFLRALGVNQSDYLQKTGCGFVVAHADIRYHRPAKLDDELLIESHVVNPRKVALTFEQSIEVVRADQGTFQCNSAQVKIAHIHLDSGKPMPIPQQLMEKLIP